MKWTIDKQFSFCYGHRVWSQKLNADYCENGDASCKCKHLHGHEGLVHVFLEGKNLERGMVTDFKHLGWLKNFLDDNLDHKFILDVNDPWFINIINAEPIWRQALTTREVQPNDTVIKPRPVLDALHLRQPSNTSNLTELKCIPALIPGTDYLAGYNLDVSELSGPEKEFFGGFFITLFVPTSEHLSYWLFKCVKAKMDLLNVQVSRVDWFETPKSRSSYAE